MAQGNHREGRGLPTIDPASVVGEFVSGASVIDIARSRRCRTAAVSEILRAAGVDPVAVGGERGRASSRGPRPSTLQPASDFSHVTAVEWAYAAGIVDGEGCITSQGHKTKDRFRLIVAQNGRVLADWFEERFGGSSTTRGAYVSKAGKVSEAHWQWGLAGQADVYSVLSGLMPYLLVKRETAESAISHMKERYGWT